MKFEKVQVIANIVQLKVLVLGAVQESLVFRKPEYDNDRRCDPTVALSFSSEARNST